MAVKKNASWAQVCLWRFTRAWGLFVDEWFLVQTSISPSLPCTNCFAQTVVCSCVYTIHSQRRGWNLAKLNIGFTAQFSWAGLIDRDFSQPYGCLAAFPRGFLIRLLQPLLICYSQSFSILTATFSGIFTFSGLSWLLQCQNSHNLSLSGWTMDGLMLKHQSVPSQGGSHTASSPPSA